MRLVNSNEPKGSVANGLMRWTFTDNDQLFDADHYRNLIVAYRNGAPVRWAMSRTSGHRSRTFTRPGWKTARPAIVLQVYRQPGANIVGTVTAVPAHAAVIRTLHSRSH